MFLSNSAIQGIYTSWCYLAVSWFFSPKKLVFLSDLVTVITFFLFEESIMLITGISGSHQASLSTEKLAGSSMYTTQGYGLTSLGCMYRGGPTVVRLYVEDYLGEPMSTLVTSALLKKVSHRRRSQDGGGVGRGEHFLPNKLIKRASKRRVNSTKQLLNAGRGHQAPRKAAQLF